MTKVRKVLNKTVIENVSNLGDARSYVGWFEDSKYDDSTPIGNVAYWQEYGTKKGIPQRPFMRPAELKNKEKWIAILKQEMQKCIETGKPLMIAFAKLGLVVQGDIQQAIVDVQEPPLKKATIRARMRRKAQKKITAALTKPLIDTGAMLASVQHKEE